MRAVFAVALWLFVGNTAFCESISAVLAHPEKFDSKRITITGVAVGDWPDFEVYDSLSSAKSGSIGRALRVDAVRSEHSDVVYNIRKVLVVGIAHDRGPSNFWDRVSVSAQKVEVLSHQLAALQPPSVIFRNDAGRPVIIRTFGHSHAQPPNAQFPMEIDEYLELPFSGGVIDVRNIREQLLARERISNVHASPYFDRRQGTIYYSITGSGLTPVPTNHAGDWRRKAILSQYNWSKH